MSLELDLSPLLDHLVERIVDEVTERLAERLFGPLVPPTPPASPELPREAEPEPEPTPDPEPAVVALEPVALEPDQPPARKKRTEGEQHTCEICGRKGTRRFVPVGDIKDGRWKCSPTATACAPQFKPPGKYTPPAVSDIPARALSANAAVTPGVTARCQDCSRTWNLTGIVLDSAVEAHEINQGHIVTIVDDQEAV
jgi:hypothetical protein